MSVVEAVGRGWAWLDETVPGWQTRVNSATLNLRAGERCICGQVFAGDVRGRELSGFDHFVVSLEDEARAWLGASDDEAGWRVAADMGFLPLQDEWMELREGWRRRLIEWAQEQQ